MLALTITSALVVLGSQSNGLRSSEEATTIIARAALVMAPHRQELDLDWNYFKYRGQNALEAMKLPPAFRTLHKEVIEAWPKQDYETVYKRGLQMFEMLPARHSTEYPLNSSFRIDWLATLGDLKSYQNDYEGAAAIFRKALEMKVIGRADGKIQWPQTNGGGQHAAYGLARMLALTGHTEEAMSWLKAAPGYYWSGCGNCAEGEAVSQKRLATVWAVAAKSDPVEAEQGLLKIVGGEYSFYLTRLAADEASQVRSARTEAAFMLGEHYFKRANFKLAKQCFDLVIRYDRSPNAVRMAISRLKTIEAREGLEHP